jgi:hypothetical protein
MNHSTKNQGNKKNNILFMVFVLFLLSNISVFAQNTTNSNGQIASTETENVENVNIEMRTMKTQESSVESNMNFVLWFMGSRQTPNATVLPVGTSAKKQFMTSGNEPNRLLIKAFLKKAVNFESSMA